MIKILFLFFLINSIICDEKPPFSGLIAATYTAFDLV